MKSLLWTILAIAAPATGAQVVDNSIRTAAETQQLREYILGQTVARCLVAKCSVFTGYLLTDSPQSSGPVAVQVQERLFASGASIPDIARVAYADPLQSFKGRAAQIAQAWDGITLHRNALVTVVSTQEDGMPVLVSSTQHDVEIIRSLAWEAMRLQRSPEAIRDAVASLSHDRNPAMAALLVTHLEKIDTIDHPDDSAMLLSQLMGSESVPADAWEDIVDHMVLDYDRLTAESRASVVGRLVDLGRSTDSRFASPGIRGLSKIGGSDSSIWTLVPPDALSRIVQNYRNLVGTGAMPRNHSLESALGIQ